MKKAKNNVATRKNISGADTANQHLLESITLPSDLRKLRVDELPALCGEIREFLIQEVSKNPGHFASSMGAVELTVALHYVFNTPYDRIVWDVGHQAYAHKILTGRRERFSTNRKLGGLSGFPSPAESEYDTFTAGHASNSISAALGMAVASQLKNESPNRHVVAVIGDASISGGLAFEGLNNAANMPNNLLIILNDNDMSIDRNVGSLNSYLAHLTASKRYNRIRYKAYRGLKKLNLVSDAFKRSLQRFNNGLKAFLTKEHNIFEGLNVRYFGPFDGHDVGRLVKVLNDIKDMTGPKILHLRTIKGKGYEPAEKNPSTWHAPGKFDPATGELPHSDTPKPPKYQDVFGQTLVELAENNKNIVGVTAAMPSGTSLAELQKAYPARFFDVGISEGHAVTFAGGLAKDGMLPFVAIYSSFLQRAYDHIIHDVAIAGLPVIFCIDRAGLVGEDGVTHHGVFDLAYMSSIPGMTVAAPSDEMMLRNLMFTAVKKADRPFAIRYPRGAGHNLEWRNEMMELPIGQGNRVKEGKDVAILSIGTILDEVKVAARKLSEQGIEASVYDMIYLKPIDENMLREVAEKNCPIIIVEDASIKGGLASAVNEWLNANGYNRLVTAIGIPDRFIGHGSVAELKRLCGLDADSISQKIENIIKNKEEIQ